VKVNSGESKVVTVRLKRDPSSPLWAAPGHFTVELGGGIPLSHGFGGTIAGTCETSCSQGAAVGGRVAFFGGYELGNGFGFGVTAGYLGMQQTTTGRAAEIQAFGIVHPNKGVANDSVAIESFLLGAYGALRLGDRFPVRLRLGAGVGLGSITDTRTGQFRVSDPTITLPYAVGPVIESPSVTWLFVEPEVRVGMRIVDRLEVSAGISMLLLVTPEAPAWNEAHAINASSDGYGQFGADTMSSFLLYAATPGVSVRYEI
jgi:hypothetical protein